LEVHGNIFDPSQHGSWAKLFRPQSWGVDDFILFSWLIIGCLILLSWLATRKLRWYPSGLQNVLEQIVESFNHFCTGIIGPNGPRYAPLVGTLFIYILLLNLLGLVPGFLSPTASLNTNLGLALVVFGAVQYYGLREHGFKKYLLHFAGEPLWLAPLMFPVHLIGELSKPLSLTLRLFGNIFGEDFILVILATLAATFLPFWLPIPFQFPLMVFAVFTSFVQALIFAMLTAVYIALITAHEEH